MRVGIDLTCWANPRGYGRFTRGLVRALFAAPSDHRWTVFVDRHAGTPPGLPAAVEVVLVGTRRAQAEAAAAGDARSLRDLAAMRRAVRDVPLDALFFPSVYSYFPVRTAATVLVAIHDVIAEDFPGLVFPDRKGRLLWRAKLWLARRRADWVITVSEHAREGILRRFRFPAERIRVVGEAPDAAFRPLPAEAVEEWRRREGIGPRTLVYLGGVNPHKNLGILVDALAALRSTPANADLELLVVGDVEGDRFTPGFADLSARITERGVAAAVRFLGYLPDEEAALALNAAAALVLPSLAEGYGLPAVEAAACGTPVVATRNSPLPELLAGGGIFFDPTHGEELTAALDRLLSEPELAAELGAVGRRRVADLGWERSAAQLLAVLEEIEEGRR